MAVPLRMDPDLGRRIREAREKRGWSRVTLSAMIGPIGNPPKGMGPHNALPRLEAGEANLTPDAAWSLAVLFEEMNPLELLEAAGVVDRDSSPAFKQAIREEVERRRLGEVNGRRRRAMALAAVADGLTDQQDHTTFGSWDHAGQRPALVEAAAAA